MYDNFTLNMYYDGNTHKGKYNLLSVSSFLLRKMYKDSLKYLSGLKYLVYNFHTILDNVVLRIYHDKSVITLPHPDKLVNSQIKEHWIPFFKSLKKYKNIQLVQYDFPDFLNQGTLGTLIRMFPLFNIPKENNINYIYISDIDDLTNQTATNTRKNVVNVYKRFKNSNDYGQFYWETALCYFMNPWTYNKVMETKHKNMYGRIRNGTILSKIKFPSSIMLDYLECIKNDCSKIQNIKKHLYNKNNYITQTAYNKFMSTEKNKLFYGIDETFTNIELMNHLFKERIKFSTYIEKRHNLFILSNKLQNLTNDYKKITAKQGKIIRSYFKYILDENIYDKKASLSKLDNIYWKYIKFNISRNDIKARKFYDDNHKFFKQLTEVEFKDLKFDKHMRNCINLLRYPYAGKIMVVQPNNSRKANIKYQNLSSRLPVPKKIFNQYDDLVFYEFHDFTKKSLMNQVKEEINHKKVDAYYNTHKSGLEVSNKWKGLTIINIDGTINKKLLQLVPTMKNIINKLKSLHFKIVRLRILNLEKNGTITRHNDRHGPFGIERGDKIRLQIPIFTNNKVVFVVWDWDGKPYQIYMTPGNIYYFDARKNHCVMNKGAWDRYHCVADVEITHKFISHSLKKLNNDKFLNISNFNTSINKPYIFKNIYQKCKKNITKQKRKTEKN